MIQLTDEGTQARQILTWAYGDLPGRLAEARRRIGVLWNSTIGDKARNEVGDVATQLSRLASGPVTMPSDKLSITGQLR